jgi:hypothetical protein
MADELFLTAAILGIGTACFHYFTAPDHSTATVEK